MIKDSSNNIVKAIYDNKTKIDTTRVGSIIDEATGKLIYYDNFPPDFTNKLLVGGNFQPSYDKPYYEKAGWNSSLYSHILNTNQRDIFSFDITHGRDYDLPASTGYYHPIPGYSLPNNGHKIRGQILSAALQLNSTGGSITGKIPNWNWGNGWGEIVLAESNDMTYSSHYIALRWTISGSKLKMEIFQNRSGTFTTFVSETTTTTVSSIYGTYRISSDWPEFVMVYPVANLFMGDDNNRYLAYGLFAGNNQTYANGQTLTNLLNNSQKFIVKKLDSNWLTAYNRYYFVGMQPGNIAENDTTYNTYYFSQLFY